jgi:tRNA nucleotidyltransferase (CCA-adding enzyme)
MNPPATSPQPSAAIIAAAIRDAGGRALLVGGYVRDRFLRAGAPDPPVGEGGEAKDLDFEVFGLEIARLEEVLGRFGEVIAVGKAFGVLRVKGIDADFSLPRRDSKTGRGHRGFLIEVDPGLDFAEAARRRDLTINSIGLDPLTGEVLDPHRGLDDLRRRVLRATDPAKFAEDSLRGLRVAQFRARFAMEPDAELRALCAGLDLSDLPGERLFEELRKLLLLARHPSLGFEFLRETALLRFFPELAAMVGVPQDREWHPEGTVWEHTLLVVDEAAGARTSDEEEDLTVLLGALCHDLGKPATTVVGEDGRVRSPGHEEEGVPIASAFLERLRAPNALIEKVGALVRYHLAPANFIAGGATAKAYRRLARKLGAAGLSARVLHRLARADHFGRGTPDALARAFPAGDEFLARAEALAVEEEPTRDAVLGRHVLARGYSPGPWIGQVLEVCREIQDETGWEDPERILDAALGRMGEA